MDMPSRMMITAFIAHTWKKEAMKVDDYNKVKISLAN